METAVQNVSEEVVKAAKEKAAEIGRAWLYNDKSIYDSLQDAYIAGAASQKPIEHTKEPINGNDYGKESENNANSL